MSDLKRTCPACDSSSSSIGAGFRDEGECPVCGFPAEAADALERARERGASDELVQRAADAEMRAIRAESEADALRSRLATIRRALGD